MISNPTLELPKYKMPPIELLVDHKDEIVSMRSVIGSQRFQEAAMVLPIVLGKTVSNDAFIFDLATMRHLLIVGASGEKTVALNAIIASILYTKHPSQVKLVLINPNCCEFGTYEKIERHFLAKLPDAVDSIIYDTQQAKNTIDSLCIEMEVRHNLCRDAGVRNIKEYNDKFIARRLNPHWGHRYLPYIVVVIDEYAYLAQSYGKEIDVLIARLTRAHIVGIHLIIGTFRPSIISNVIKTNFPTRIAFRVFWEKDSRNILDASGAEQLTGWGDLLFSSDGNLIRVQCAFIDYPEIEEITGFIGKQEGYLTAYLLPEYANETDQKRKTANR